MEKVEKIIPATPKSVVTQYKDSKGQLHWSEDQCRIAENRYKLHDILKENYIIHKTIEPFDNDYLNIEKVEIKGELEVIKAHHFQYSKKHIGEQITEPGIYYIVESSTLMYDDYDYEYYVYKPKEFKKYLNSLL